jgi:microcystin-dependent protein
MTQPFFGEIQLFGFNFAPRDWAFCSGASLPISQNTALFSLIGTTYGGNGVSTFNLPNFQDRTPCSQGHGPGLTQRQMGQAFGASTASLADGQIPAHSHGVEVFGQRDSSKRAATPANGYALSTPGHATAYAAGSTQANTTLAPQSVGNTGGNQPHDNMQPYLAVNFCIALQGIYPTRP